jgi:hypothetical protein
MHRWMIGLWLAATGCGLSVGAQACDTSIQPVGGRDGYQNRAYGCEGLYESPVSGPPLELVSLTWGAFPKSDDLPETLRITARPPQRTLYVRAEGIPAGLYYRMDSVMQAGSGASYLDWPLAVVQRLKLDLATIGILAYADDPDGTAFVPAAVDAAPDDAAPAVAEIRPLVPIDSLRWRVLDESAADAGWNDADQKGDCFVITIPHAAVAHRAFLQVAWDDPGSGQSQSKEFLIEP